MSKLYGQAQGVFPSQGQRQSPQGTTWALLVLCAAAPLALTGCGFSDLYEKRKPRCKVDCQPPPANRNEDGTTRESLGLPMAPQDWISLTPKAKLNEEDLTQLLISNPFVTVTSQDASYGQWGTSLEAILGELTIDIDRAAGLARAGTGGEPARECYLKQFDRAPRQDGNTVVYELNSGLCFSLDQLQHSLNLGDDAGAQQAKALAYENAYRLKFPVDQIAYALSGDALTQHLLELGENPAASILPLTKSVPQSRRVVELAHLKAQGIAVRSADGSTSNQLMWDYVSLAGRSGETGFRLSEAAAASPETGKVWQFRGSMVHSSGTTADPRGLRLSGAADGVGYVRIVDYNDFTVTLPPADAEASGSGNAAPSQGFASGNDASLSGTLTITIPQPGSVLRFTAVGLGEACLVELFLGTNINDSSRSLGQLDLCRSSGI